MPLIYFDKWGFLFYFLYICTRDIKTMSKYEFFNPNRVSHSKLMQFIEKKYVSEGDKVMVVPLGKGTQHIFKNNRYMLSINWGLV